MGKHLHPLDPNEICSTLEPWLASGLHVFDSIGSTNLWLANHVRSLPDVEQICGQSCFTDEQTQGRGRRGRVWKSIAGNDITFSMAWSFAATDALGALTLATAVTVATSLETVCGQPLSIKWPNDIYCMDRKLVGILAEASSGAGHSSAGPIVVIGVGVNLGSDDSSSVSVNRIGLLELVSSPLDRNRLAAQLLTDLSQSMQKFEQTGLAGFKNAYNERNYLQDRPVTVQQADRSWTGTAAGLADDGALNIDDDAGVRRQVYAADVTVRWRDGPTD